MLFSMVALLSIGAARANPGVVPAGPGPLTGTMAFMFEMANGSARVKEGLLREAGSDPALQDIFKGAVEKFLLEDLAARLAVPLEASMPAADMAECTRFASSPASSAFAKAAQGAMEMNALLEAYRSLPDAHKKEVDRYFGSACGKKVAEYLNTDQARSIGRAYGEEITCEYVKEARNEMLAILQARGKCR